MNRSSPPKILCVNNDAGILNELTNLLGRNFTVLTCLSAEDALKILKDNLDCTILLTDIYLPKKNGLRLLNEAKQLFPNVVRAILSEQIDLKDLMEAVNSSEIQKLILKPWNEDYFELQMLEALQVHLLLTENEYLQHLAITDIVTGLTNHRYFQQTLTREVERCKRHGRPLSLLMIDVDHFKVFNDRYGHPEGDRALARIGQTLIQQVRSIDTVSRYGGEEMTIIMPDTPGKNAHMVADRVRVAIEEMVWELPDSPKITVSIGLCEGLTHGQTSQELILAADQALYQAKHRGRNQTVLADIV